MKYDTDCSASCPTIDKKIISVCGTPDEDYMLSGRRPHINVSITDKETGVSITAEVSVSYAMIIGQALISSAASRVSVEKLYLARQTTKER